MSEVPYYGWVNDWQEAQTFHPDQPVILVWVRNTSHGLCLYMRYRGEFHCIDEGSYTNSIGRQQRWSIAGVWFNNDSIYWMLDNSIALPFSTADLVLYQLTWGDSCE